MLNVVSLWLKIKFSTSIGGFQLLSRITTQTSDQLFHVVNPWKVNKCLYSSQLEKWHNHESKKNNLIKTKKHNFKYIYIYTYTYSAKNRENESEVVKVVCKIVVAIYTPRSRTPWIYTLSIAFIGANNKHRCNISREASESHPHSVAVSETCRSPTVS